MARTGGLQCGFSARLETVELTPPDFWNSIPGFGLRSSLPNFHVVDNRDTGISDQGSIADGLDDRVLTETSTWKCFGAVQAQPRRLDISHEEIGTPYGKKKYFFSEPKHLAVRAAQAATATAPRSQIQTSATRKLTCGTWMWRPGWERSRSVVSPPKRRHVENRSNFRG